MSQQPTSVPPAVWGAQPNPALQQPQQQFQQPPPQAFQPPLAQQQPPGAMPVAIQQPAAMLPPGGPPTTQRRAAVAQSGPPLQNQMTLNYPPAGPTGTPGPVGPGHIPVGPPPGIQAGPPPGQQPQFVTGMTVVQPSPGPAPGPPPVATQQPAAAAAGARPTIQALIRQFAKTPGCERYAADGEKIKLLEDYLWLRQLTPSLPFETFLELYKSVADFDDQNLKHPADAIKQYLPRAKKAADAAGRHHWSAKEVVDYVALFVDIIREAESNQTPIPMQFNQFLTSQQLVEQFLAGTFAEAPQPRASSPRATGGAKAAEKQRPNAAGQRVIYTSATQRQYRGVTQAVWQDQQSQQLYANFKADSGEEFQGVGIATLEICADPPPNPPQTVEGDQLPELGHGNLLIPKNTYPLVVQALAMTVPMGTVQVGDVIYSFNHQFPTGHVALLEVVNGETGPFVDARLCIGTVDNVLAECNPPRKNAEGTYTFEIPEGVFTLEVRGNL